MMMMLMMMQWQEANDERQEQKERQRQLLMQDETIDIEVALLQEREQQIRQLEVQTLLMFWCFFVTIYVLTSYW